MVVRTRRRRAVLTGVLVALVAGVLAAPSLAAAASLVVHVPGPARVVPAAAKVTLNTTDTAASGSDEYGWFSTAAIPADAATVSVTATGAGATVPAWNLADGSEIWLDAAGHAFASRAQAVGHVTVHVRSATPTGITLDATDEGGPITVGAGAVGTGEITFTVPVAAGTKKITLDPKRGASIGVLVDGKPLVLDATRWGEAWVSDTWAGVRTSKSWADGFATIHYRRPDATFTGWGLHVWTGAANAGDVTWGSPMQATGTDEWGTFWKVPLVADATKLNYIIHKGDTKDPSTKDQALNLASTGGEVWLDSGSKDGDDNAAYSVPVIITVDADLAFSKAIWLSKELLAWPYAPDGAGTRFELRYAAPNGTPITLDGTKLVGGDGSYPLTIAPGFPSDVAPGTYLAAYTALSLPQAAIDNIKTLVRGQLVVVQTTKDGVALARASSVQIGSVLDAVYTPTEQMGVSFTAGTPTVRVWAPTATDVHLLRYATATGALTETLPMTRSDATGTWSLAGSPAWAGSYYLFEVKVWVPTEQAVRTNVVTDPWSVSLSMNSLRSELTDLATPALAPTGWSTLAKPPLKRFVDSSIYELHVRDFSVSDQTVPAAMRGTYEAFTQPASDGMKHLTALAKAGLTHVHLMPVFDFATVNEDRSVWADLTGLGSYGAVSAEQQAAIGAHADGDGFNWGYDPWHFTVPEGSYATNPVGDARTKEFRDMVAGINGAGLRVVMDVVYNHTTASGQGDRSVLDRVVPGYYHRLNADGTVATSTCCANTATERAMMGRLVRDSILTWAKDYKVDGFRFDLMGHMPKALLLAIRADLDALTVAKDGVDGKAIILYGEGWNFGEVQDDARFVQATQANMAGTGIATFDDRVRDGVRGGGPFDDNPTVQGFGSGLYTAPNGNTANGSRSAQLTRLKVLTDNVKLGLVGEMKSYRLRDRFGSLTTGELIPYNGKAGAGYTTNPSDQVAYVDAHDNETLFDALAFKLKTTTSMADRVRMQVLAQAIPELGQGIPFFLAGSDILRSKSTDKNSYNSGDWFNVLDWSLGTNGFGRGLPPQGDNRSRLSFATAILGKPSFQPTKADMTASFNRFRDYLRIRYSSPLFRLGAGSEVKKRVSFLYGKAAAPGVITMRIVDVGRGIANLDRKARSITVVFNASATTQKVTVAALRRSHVSLHPVLRASTDRVVRRSSARRGVLTVPARTVAVFVES